MNKQPVSPIDDQVAKPFYQSWTMGLNVVLGAFFAWLISPAGAESLALMPWLEPFIPLILAIVNLYQRTKTHTIVTLTPKRANELNEHSAIVSALASDKEKQGRS